MKIIRKGAFALVVILCLLMFAACGGANFGGIYKEMKQSDVDAFNDFLSEKQVDDAFDLMDEGFYMRFKYSAGGTEYILDVYHKMENQGQEYSMVTTINSGSQTTKTEVYHKDGWTYLVTYDGERRSVNKMQAESVDISNNKNTIKSYLAGLNYADLDIEESAQKGFDLYISKFLGTYKIKAVIEKEIFEQIYHQTFEEFKFESYFIYGKKGFLGFKLEFIFGSSDALSSALIEVYPFSGTVSFPSYLKYAQED